MRVCLLRVALHAASEAVITFVGSDAMVAVDAEAKARARAKAAEAQRLCRARKAAVRESKRAAAARNNAVKRRFAAATAARRATLAMQESGAHGGAQQLPQTHMHEQSQLQSLPSYGGTAAGAAAQRNSVPSLAAGDCGDSVCCG